MRWVCCIGVLWWKNWRSWKFGQGRGEEGSEVRSVVDEVGVVELGQEDGGCVNVFFGFGH